MRISLIVAIVLVAVSAVAQSQQVEAPKDPKAVQEPFAQGTQQKQAPDPPRNKSIGTVVPLPPQGPDESIVEAKRREREVVAQESNARYSAILAVLTGLMLTIVGWQAYETRRSVESNQLLNKALHEQWIDVSDWVCPVSQVEYVGSGAPAELDVAELGFVVTNNTPLPLFLERIEFVGTPDYGVLWINHKLRPMERLRPNPIMIQLTADQVSSTETEHGMGFVLFGRAHFTDSFGDQKVTLFGRRGRITKTAFESETFQGNLSEMWDKLMVVDKKRKAAKKTHSDPEQIDPS